MANDKLNAFFKSFAEAEDQLDYKMAHETVGEKVPVISTGSYLLDDALSSGGLPKGRIIQYYGPPGSGKTLMAMIAIVEAQKADPESQQVFIDAEQTFDPNWAEVLGVDTSRVIHIEGDTAANGRKCFELLLGVPKEDKSTHTLKGKVKPGLLDKIVDKTFNINLIVLDSLGAIIPPGEDVAVVGKMNMALMARFLTTTFRKLTLEVSKAQVPFIVINHKRDNLEPYGVDHTYSGGNTYSHTLSANVYFDAIKRKDAQILNDQEEKIGHLIRATVEKSKFGPWPRTKEFKVNFSIGVVDKHEEIASLAINYNIIQRPNNVSYVYNDTKWVGEGKLHEAIKNDENFAQELLLKIDEVRERNMEEKRQAQKDRLQNDLKTSSPQVDIESDSSEVEDENSPKKRGRKPKND